MFEEHSLSFLANSNVKRAIEGIALLGGPSFRLILEHLSDLEMVWNRGAVFIRVYGPLRWACL